MTSILQAEPIGKVVIGVDTHKYVHTAVVVGGAQGSLSVAADRGGYEQLAQWAAQFGQVLGFGVEGTGSYGVGLASYLRRHGHKVVEVNRPDRRVRRQRGKSDSIDAENAARAVLAGTATATPKTAEGTVEMFRHTKIARDTAVKARTQVMVTLKVLIVTVPDELRDQLQGLPKMTLSDRCAGRALTQGSSAGGPVHRPHPAGVCGDTMWSSPVGSYIFDRRDLHFQPHVAGRGARPGRHLISARLHAGAEYVSMRNSTVPPRTSER
ncbi:transposase [Streptomyces sp. NPDC050549]|uniref:IS110 family transposase n=1 Tax=Streptomyces sp. NPDC050549 TaxID=3155406 RepID=UPI003436D5A2